MKKPLVTITLITSLASSLLGVSTTEQIIAKAREYLGGEPNLSAIKSIYYKGIFEATLKRSHAPEEKLSEGAPAPIKQTGTIEIWLEKPSKQRLEVVYGGFTKTTVLNDYEGWKRLLNNKDPNDLTFNILRPPELKRLRADTFENLYFFNGIKKLRGTIIDKGEVQKDGHKAHLLVFKYEDDHHYQRYFDPETGKLMATINSQGVEIREVNQTMIEGVRFPKKIISLLQGEVINTVAFEEIKVNEPMDSNLFEFPSI